MKKKYVILSFALIMLIFSIQNCLTDSSEKKETKIETKNENKNGNGYNESFRKTGWITESKYRSVIFIITDDECRNSSPGEIEEKIKFESYKNLQKELNPAYNRNASTQIKSLTDNFGKIVKVDKECVEGNIYFYDLEKKDLKSDFQKIKNLK